MHFHGHRSRMLCSVLPSSFAGSVDGKVLLLQVSKKKLLQTFVHNTPKADAAVGAVEDNGKGNQIKLEASAGEADIDPRETEFGEYGTMEEDDDDGEEGDGEADGTLSVECVGFSCAELKWAASGGLDKTLKVWDLVTGTCRSVCAHGGSVVALQWHSALPIVTTASLDRAVRLWDARNGALLLRLIGHTDILTNLDAIRIPAEGANDDHAAAGPGSGTRSGTKAGA